MIKVIRLMFVLFALCYGIVSHAQCRLTWEVVSKAKCNGAGQGGQIRVTATGGGVIGAGNIFRLWSNGVVIRQSAAGDNIIYNVPPGDDFDIDMSSSLTCGSVIHTNDTVTVCDDVKMPFAITMDTASTVAVKCQGSSNVTVLAQAKEGVGPYTYQLFAGAALLGTQSGAGQVMFNVSSAETTFTVKVKDDGCSLSGATAEYTATLTDYSNVSVIKGDRSVCPGGTINLTADYAGASNYKWTGPNGFSSTSQTVSIPSVTTANNGTYTLVMNVPGCSSPFTESVTVSVGSPPKPDFDAEVYVCINVNKSLAGSASVTSSDYELVWYGPNNPSVTIGATAPTVVADEVKEMRYYVSQKDKNSSCESEKAEIKVIIKDSPSPIGNSNINYCLDPSNPNPTMIILNAGTGNTYNLYDASSGGNLLDSNVSQNDTARFNVSLTVGVTYYVETIDKHGCIAQSRTAKKVPNIEALIKLSTDEICLGASLTLNAGFSGKTVWTKPDNSTATGNSLTISNAALSDAGIYKISVEPWAGCIMRDDTVVKVRKTNTPSVATATYGYCLNETPSAMTATASAQHFLRWYDEDGFLLITGDGKARQEITPGTTTAGTFLYYVSQVDSALLCESEKITVTVNVTPPPAQASASNLKTCILNPPAVEISNTENGKIYEVYDAASGGNLIGSASGNNGTVTVSGSNEIFANTTYYVAVKNAEGCYASNRTPIDIIAKSRVISQVEIKYQSTITITLTAEDIPGATYEWTYPGGTYTGRVLTVPNASDANEGIYTLTVKVPGCPDAVVTQEIKLNQKTPPAVNTDAYSYCKGEEPSLMSAVPDVGFTLKWYDYNGNTMQLPKPSTDNAGTFVYSVSQLNDTTSDESARAYITIVVFPVTAPIVISDVKTCINTKPLIQVSNTVVGKTYYLYEDEDDDTPIASFDGNGGQQDFVHDVVVEENTYWYISCKNTGECESPKTQFRIIAANHIINLASSNSAICEGSNGQLIATAVDGATYKWTKPDGSVYYEQMIEINNASQSDVGTYSLTTLTPACDEIKQDFEVTVGKPAAPQAMDDVEYCQNGVATPLSGSASPGCTLVWYDRDGVKLPSDHIPPTSVPGTFSYYVSQAILNDMACESENRTEVKVIIHALPEPVFSINPVAVCSGRMPSIEIENSISGYYYRPYGTPSGITPVGDTVTGDGGSIYLPTVVDLLSDTTYYVEVTSILGCVSLSRTPVHINVTQLYISPDKLPTYKKGTPYSEWLSTNAIQPSYRITYGELPQGILLSSSGEISGTAPAAGGIEHKTFVVEVEDNAGCKAEKEYILNCEMTVSEVFTPNGDGVNDYFMRGYHLIIFDRLGRKIFEGNDGWDGTHKGSTVATDTYFYILYYTDDKGQNTKTGGNVTVLL